MWVVSRCALEQPLLVQVLSDEDEAVLARLVRAPPARGREIGRDSPRFAEIRRDAAEVEPRWSRGASSVRSLGVDEAAREEHADALENKLLVHA